MAVGMETPNELMVVFSNTVTAGFAALEGSVNSVFGLMIALVVALTGIQWALSPNRDILAGAFGKVLLVGLFAWLINDWQTLAETLYAGFIELGLIAGGGALTRADFLNPGAVLAQGWVIVKAIGETPRPVDNPLDIVGNLADALILGLAMIGILLAFAILALQIIVCLLEFKIVTLAGFVLLPFGIWSKSAFLAERPLGYVVSSGLKVLALAIVVSGARTVFDQLQPSTTPDIYEALSILVAAILLAMLAMFIPSLASALVTGGPALGAGSALTGGLAVAGAGILAGAGVMGVGSATGAGAQRLTTSARSAAGAGTGRMPSLPDKGSGSGDLPGGRGGGGAAPPRPSGEGPQAGPSRRDPPASMSGLEGSGGAAADHETQAGRPQATLDRETQKAQADFHKAASASGASKRVRHAGRSAALQTFFIANAGRGLMPSGETSGTLSPTLRTEEP